MVQEAYAELNDRNRRVAPFVVQESSARLSEEMPFVATEARDKASKTRKTKNAKTRALNADAEDLTAARFSAGGDANVDADEEAADSDAFAEMVRRHAEARTATSRPAPVATSKAKPEATIAQEEEAMIEIVRPAANTKAEPLPIVKPPRVGVNIEWVQKGVGWDCREVYYVGKKRHRRHLGHIGRQKWEEMRESYQGLALERVLSEWIEARRAEKSAMTLTPEVSIH